MRRHLLLREACLSSALTSDLSGLTRALPPSGLYSSQAVNTRAAPSRQPRRARNTVAPFGGKATGTSVAWPPTDRGFKVSRRRRERMALLCRWAEKIRGDGVKPATPLPGRRRPRFQGLNTRRPHSNPGEDRSSPFQRVVI